MVEVPSVSSGIVAADIGGMILLRSWMSYYSCYGYRDLWVCWHPVLSTGCWWFFLEACSDHGMVDPTPNP